MIEGIYTDTVLMHPTIRAYPPQPQNMSGIRMGSQAIYRYALDESDYPTLVLANYLFDGEMDFIQPGHYELALSDDWKFFILTQSKTPVALIPVIRTFGWQYSSRSFSLLFSRYQCRKYVEIPYRHKGFCVPQRFRFFVIPPKFLIETSHGLHR